MSLEVIGELARHDRRPLSPGGDYRGDEFPADGIHREWRARILSQRHADEVRLRPLTIDETAIATTLILAASSRARVTWSRQCTSARTVSRSTSRSARRARRRGPGGWPANPRSTCARHHRRRRPSRLVDGCPRTRGDRAGGSRHRALLPPGRSRRRGGPTDVRARPPLQELEDAAILYPFQYVDGGYYDFRHQLLRDAIYDAVRHLSFGGSTLRRPSSS